MVCEFCISGWTDEVVGDSCIRYGIEQYLVLVVGAYVVSVEIEMESMLMVVSIIDGGRVLVATVRGGGGFVLFMRLHR